MHTHVQYMTIYTVSEWRKDEGRRGGGGKTEPHTTHPVPEVGHGTLPGLLQLGEDGLSGVQEGSVGEEEVFVETVVH